MALFTIVSWIEGLGILLAVHIVGSVTAINDWSKDRKFRAVHAKNKEIDIKVIRQGKDTTVLISTLMVGDVVVLDTGDQVPADGIFIEGYDLKIDESAMTGEPILIKKTEKQPFLLSGCQVGEGYGKMLVTAVGKYSEWGKLKAALVSAEQGQTPLEERLDALAGRIGKVGLSAGVATFVVLLISWLIVKSMLINIGLHVIVIASVNLLPGQEWNWNWSDLIQVVRFLVIGITIVVVAVPEGLPLAVAISLV